jgi:hypothetical protein
MTPDDFYSIEGWGKHGMFMWRFHGISWRTCDFKKDTQMSYFLGVYNIL